LLLTLSSANVNIRLLLVKNFILLLEIPHFRFKLQQSFLQSNEICSFIAEFNLLESYLPLQLCHHKAVILQLLSCPLQLLAQFGDYCLLLVAIQSKLLPLNFELEPLLLGTLKSLCKCAFLECH
jgi:hypothetical protein